MPRRTSNRPIGHRGGQRWPDHQGCSPDPAGRHGLRLVSGWEDPAHAPVPAVLRTSVPARSSRHEIDVATGDVHEDAVRRRVLRRVGSGLRSTEPGEPQRSGPGRPRAGAPPRTSMNHWRGRGRHRVSSVATMVTSHPRRPWTSETASNGPGRAIMTPSPNSSMLGSRGWTRQPGSSSATRNSRVTRSRRHSSGLGETCRAFVTPTASTAGSSKLTVNACLDLVRRRRRRPDRGRAFADQPAHGVRLPGALADRELVDQALRRLDPGHRAVVALHYLLGMPLPEVAAGPGDPARDGEVPAPLLARGDAGGTRRRNHRRARPTVAGGQVA